MEKLEAIYAFFAESTTEISTERFASGKYIVTAAIGVTTLCVAVFMQSEANEVRQAVNIALYQ